MVKFNFKEKVVVVTGAAGGIGFETARQFLASGATVVLGDRNESALSHSVEAVHAAGYANASSFPCDVSNVEDVAQMFKITVQQHGKVDVLVNNAGIDGALGRLDEQSITNIEQVYQVNVLGTTLVMREALRHMRPRGTGVIVNVASIAGHVGFAGSPVYTASKHAILGLTKAVALENARNGIRICAVSPGAVDTDMTNRFTGGNEAVKTAMIEAVPLGRMCSPAEIARGILFMASDDASLLVGQTLNLDGGWANVKS